MSIKKKKINHNFTLRLVFFLLFNFKKHIKEEIAINIFVIAVVNSHPFVNMLFIIITLFLLLILLAESPLLFDSAQLPPEFGFHRVRSYVKSSFHSCRSNAVSSDHENTSLVRFCSIISETGRKVREFFTSKRKLSVLVIGAFSVSGSTTLQQPSTGCRR